MNEFLVNNQGVIVGFLIFSLVILAVIRGLMLEWAGPGDDEEEEWEDWDEEISK